MSKISFFKIWVKPTIVDDGIGENGTQHGVWGLAEATQLATLNSLTAVQHRAAETASCLKSSGSCQKITVWRFYCI